MPERKQLTIDVIENDTKKTVDGILNYIAYSSGDRTKRALTALGLCLLGILVVIPIPIVHLIAPWILLITGIAMFISRIRQHQAKENVETLCPHCEKQVSIELSDNDQLPKWEYCPDCGASLQLCEQGSEKS